MVLALLLSACVSAKKENYLPPEGLEAGRCLEFCRSSRFECRQAVQVEYDGCEIRFEYRNESYRRCVAQRGVSRCIGLKPVPCGTPPFRQCTEVYDECFVGCGGVIE